MNDLRNEVLVGLFAQLGKPSEKSINEVQEEVSEEVQKERLKALMNKKQEIEPVQEVIETETEASEENEIINNMTHEQQDILRKDTSTNNKINIGETELRELIRSDYKLTKEREREIMVYNSKLIPDLFSYRWTDIGSRKTSDVRICRIMGITYELVNEEQLYNIYYQTYLDKAFEYGITNKVSETALKRFFVIMKSYERSITTLKKRKEKEYDGVSTFRDGINHYMKLVELCRGENKPDNELHAIKWMHHIANTKCKFLYEIDDKYFKTKYPIMLYLYSRIQGTSKSRLVDLIYGSYGERYMPMSGGSTEMSSYKVKREYTTSIVTYFDDMHKMSESSITTLKGWLTAKKETHNALYTNQVDQYTPTATFIASCNMPIGDIIKDQTGMRRYWQVEFNRVICPNELDALEASGYFERMYTIINEKTFEDEYEQYMDRVKEIQDGYVENENKIEEFVKNFNLVDSNGGEFDHVMPTKYLYLSFMKYAYENNYENFLKEYGFDVGEKVILDYIQHDENSTHEIIIKSQISKFANRINKIMKSAGNVYSQYGVSRKYVFTCNEEYNELVEDLPHYMVLKKNGDAKLNKTGV